MINSNHGEISTFYLILFASYSSTSSRASPRALREKPRKNPSSHLHQSHPTSTPWLAAEPHHRAASSEAAAKPASSIVVPTEGLVIPASAVIESTGGDQNLAALDPLEEEPDSHKGDWCGSDITDRTSKRWSPKATFP